MGLIDDALGGSIRAISRLATLIERNDEQAARIVDLIYPHSGKAATIGITGPPGAGKSSLTNELIPVFRALGARVGVIAVDPSSALSGGAALGDRIRMLERFEDSGVFIRSMASRGRLGGLAIATPGLLHLLDAAGFDVVMIETVGIGQEEIDVSRYVDTTVVVQVPGLGDSIQAMKAGILEIADVYAVNKADQPGADVTAREIRNMMTFGKRLRDASAWSPPVIKVSARTRLGIEDLANAISSHQRHLRDSGELGVRRTAAAAQEIQDQIDLAIRSRLNACRGSELDLAEDVALRKRTPRSAAASAIEQLRAI